MNTNITNEGQLFLAGATDLSTTTPINVRKIEGTYPQIDNVIPHSNLETLFSVDPALMAKAMTAATKLGLKAVKFEQVTEKNWNPLKITGKTEDGEDVTIIVMPIREKNQ